MTPNDLLSSLLLATVDRDRARMTEADRARLRAIQERLSAREARLDTAPGHVSTWLRALTEENER